MAAINWANVLEVAAELTTVPLALQTSILAHVNGNGVAVDVFDGEDGTDTKLARQYKAAHMGAMTAEDAGGGAGPIISETEGAISRTYANLVTSSSDLGMTKYGRAFQMMCRMHAAGAWLP